MWNPREGLVAATGTERISDERFLELAGVADYPSAEVLDFYKAMQRERAARGKPTGLFELLCENGALTLEEESGFLTIAGTSLLDRAARAVAPSAPSASVPQASDHPGTASLPQVIGSLDAIRSGAQLSAVQSAGVEQTDPSSDNGSGASFALFANTLASSRTSDPLEAPAPVIIPGPPLPLDNTLASSRSPESVERLVTYANTPPPIASSAHGPGRSVAPPTPPNEDIDCPRCAERIKARAKVCRYCGADLVAEEQKSAPIVTAQTPLTPLVRRTRARWRMRPRRKLVIPVLMLWVAVAVALPRSLSSATIDRQPRTRRAAALVFPRRHLPRRNPRPQVTRYLHLRHHP
ncbi:MAG TPA: hypothetical protein VFF73_19490, partial [Planctomycetota bacterium]|nr:hypothetical protein [Planctomycetota bacterium]